MATHYDIRVSSLNGEKYSDTVDSDLKGHIAWFANSPLYDLGPKIAVRREKNEHPEETDTIVTHHYFHNGRITVLTRRGQYTTAQRLGQRRF